MVHTRRSDGCWVHDRHYRHGDAGESWAFPGADVFVFIMVARDLRPSDGYSEFVVGYLVAICGCAD